MLGLGLRLRLGLVLGLFSALLDMLRTRSPTFDRFSVVIIATAFLVAIAGGSESAGGRLVPASALVVRPPAMRRRARTTINCRQIDVERG